MTHRLLGLILAVGVCAVGCREQGSGTPATERKGGPEVARVEARDADENPRKENGARRDGGEREVAVIPVAEERRSNPEGFLRIDWELETSGRNLYLPEDRKNRRYLIARGWDDDLRVEQVADFTRFVRIRNEGEALRYVRLLDGLQGLLPGLDCFDPVKTPGELLTDRLHPQPTQREGRAESDLKLYRLPKDAKIDRAELRLERAGPSGPFVVQRYLACMPKGEKGALVLARETVGAKGEYHREVVRTVADGPFN